MRSTESPMSAEAADLGEAMERRLRRIFLGSAIMCIWIVLEMTIIMGHEGRLPKVARVGFLPMLLWSLAVTCYAFLALWDIARKRRVALADMARRDSLSGAFTEQYLQERLKEERTKAQQTGKMAAVAYVKVHGLESIRESYGHTVSNVVLRDIVRIMMSNVAPNMPVARLTGQEFALLMPETTVKAAEHILQTIHQVIAHYRLDLGPRGVIQGLDVRIGIAACPADFETAEDLTQVARRKPLGLVLEAPIEPAGPSQTAQGIRPGPSGP